MIQPVIVTAYVENLLKKDRVSNPTVKQRLAAIRMLFNRTITGSRFRG
jgi:hypothetical protein